MRKVFLIILSFICVLTVMSGCSSKDTQTEKANAQEDNMSNVALQIMDSTSAMDPNLLAAGVVKDVSIGAVLADMFENPQINVDNTSENTAVVTVSGKYRLSPDQGYYQSGKIGYNVYFDRKLCTLQSDPNQIKQAISYYALCMVGYY